MAPLTALLFCYRLPTISATEFKTYIEETHVPLVKSLLGADHPLTHTRYYTPSSSYVMGTPSATDADLIAVITYESRDHMERSMALRQAPGIKEVIEADEARFMDRSKVKVVVMGDDDIGRSLRDE